MLQNLLVGFEYYCTVINVWTKEREDEWVGMMD